MSLGELLPGRQKIVVIHDLLAVTLALPIAIILRDTGIDSQERILTISTMMPLLTLSAILIMLITGYHRALWRYTTTQDIIHLARYSFAVLLVFYSAQFFVDRLEELPRSAPILHFLVAMFFLTGSRLAYASWIHWVERKTPRSFRHHILLVGSGDGTALFIQMLRDHRREGCHVVGILTNDLTRHRTLSGVPVLGRLEQFDRVVASLQVCGMKPDRIIITRSHDELGKDALDDVLLRAQKHQIAIEQLPDLMRFRRQDPLVGATNDGPMSPATFARLKRCFDILVSAVILIMILPIWISVAAGVAVWIQRPVLFRQIRPGHGMRRFELLKFRTMRDPVDAYGRQFNDAQRTPPFGRALRRSRLDELPQFWNVLVGDMAIIGPRPLLEGDLLRMPDGGMLRSRVRPGITGWAQINGGHLLSASEKHALDRWYSENASLYLDLKIVFLTLRMVLLGESINHRAIEVACASKLHADAGEWRSDDIGRDTDSELPASDAPLKTKEKIGSYAARRLAS